MQNATMEKNGPYSVGENTFFHMKQDTSLSSINTNRHIVTICKISESNKQKPRLCDQLQAALAIAVWPSHVVRAPEGSLLSVADRIGQAAVAVIALWYRCLVQGRTKKFLMIFKKSRAIS